MIALDSSFKLQSNLLIAISIFLLSNSLKAVPTISLTSSLASINQTICLGNPIQNIVYQVGGTGNNATAVGLPVGVILSYNSSNNIVTISGNPSSAGTFNIIITATGGGSITENVTIFVRAIPTVNTIPNQVLCSGQSTLSINFSGPISGTTFSSWSNSNNAIGLLSSGDGTIAPFTAQNFTSSEISGQIFITPIANGCLGTSTLVTTVTVKPVPTVFQIPSQTLCNGANTAIILFNSTIVGSSFAWTNSNPTVGISTSGTGNSIPSFLANNPTNTQITAAISVTPSFNGCSGIPTLVTAINVKPTPTVNVIENQSVCNGGAIQPINFTGPVLNTFFLNWSNSNSQIGLPSAGNGNIPSFVGHNFSSDTIQGVISVIPTANGCNGISTPVTSIKVRPSPQVDQINDITVCAGIQVVTPSFTSNFPNAQYSWTNSNNAIGLATVGQSNILPFASTNNFGNILTATIEVSASEFNCLAGNPSSFLINVKPLPVLTIGSQTIEACSQDLIQNVNLSSSVGNTLYSWVNNNPDFFDLQLGGQAEFLPSFQINNSSDSIVSGILTITPIANGCYGVSQNLNINVKPSPQVIGLNDINLCNNQSSSLIEFTSSLDSTTSSWINLNPEIGLGANGVGFFIPSFLATNNTNSIIQTDLNIYLVSNDGCSSFSSVKINVLPSDALPNSSFQYSVSDNVYTFSIMDSIGITSANWNFGETNTGFGNIINHVFAQNGTYNVTLSATNACGEISSSSQSVGVNVGIELQSSNITFDIFPNPTKDFSFIQLENSDLELQRLLLMDVNGNCVLIQEIKSSNTNIELNVSDIKAGNYFVIVESKKSLSTRKFIKL